MFEEFDARTETRIVRDADGVARVLSNQDRFVATKAATPRLAAKDYLSRYGRLLGLRAQHLKNLLLPVEHTPTDAAVEYRFVAEKHQFDLTTVAFHQTYLGLPVWEAGLSVAMKHQPLRVIGARSTLHPKPEIARSSAKHLRKLQKLDAETLGKHLGLAKHASDATPLRIHNERLMVHQHDETRLRHAMAQPQKRGAAFHSGAPRLPLPSVHSSIKDGAHYVVRAVRFGFDFPPIRPLNWVALVEVETMSVLLLRPFVDNVTGLVFPADPATLGGPTANAGNAALNRFRSSITLDGIDAPVKGVQALRGNHVRVADVIEPYIAPPTKPAGKTFAFKARSDDFAAVNAYYNCDRVFRLVERLGFSVADYFPNTKFPTRVDHRGHWSKTKPLGIEINAHCAGDESGTGIAYTTFSLADTRNTKQPIGIACDWRIVLHELLGHGVLYSHIGSPRFKFAHSAGDSFAAIINDPKSNARDRYATFPWLSGIAKDQQRRHDRTAADGYGWNGDIALHPLDPKIDWSGYSNEQILSSTMFRFYQSIGGDSGKLADKRFAADMTCHILLVAIQALTAATSPSDAAHFASTLMKADRADWPAAGISGGAYHKVMRWAFEKQGLYQHAAAKRPNNKTGDPPPVDVYIDDGRHGEYQYQSDYWNCRAIWNRRHKDGGTKHEAPIAGATNYAYVKIKNRGFAKATKVVVRGFSGGRSADLAYPRDWQPMKTAQLAAADVPPNSSDEILVGPFAWAPAQAGRNCMLMVVSSSGDSSNIDNFIARDAMPNWRLVPHDNNIGQRNVTVAKKTRQRRGQR
jgi:zinc metalloprotease ZmpB